MRSAIVAFVFSAQALIAKEAIEVAVNERIPVSVVLSSNLHNRISVIEGAIETIIANPYYFKVDIHEKLGQAFLTIIRPLEKPQALSVVTSSGFVQDFLITAGEEEPTIIFLKEPEETQTISFKQSLADIETISQILEGKVPHGFGKRPFLPNDILEIGELNLHTDSISVFEGALENIYVLKISNHKKGLLKINTDTLKTSEINWVFTSQSELQKKESTTLLISKRRD